MKNIIQTISFILIILSTVIVEAQEENAYIRNGNGLYAEKQYSDAESEYLKALDKNPNSFEAQFNRANALYKQGKMEEAVKKYENLSKQTINKEQLANVYHNLGNAYLNSQKLDESIKSYKSALRNNPGDVETKYNLIYAQKLKQQQEQNQQCQNPNEDKQNQDKNKEQQKNQQQNQEQNQNQDKKDQQQQQNQNQNKEEQQKKQQSQPQKISKEDAERLLEAIMGNEKELQEKLKKEKARANRIQIEKDW